MDATLEQSEREYDAARRRLEASGKTKEDVRDFLRFHQKHRRQPPGWSDLQAAIAIEHLLLEALIADRYGANFSPAYRTMLALDLAKARENRVKAS
jgi:hypothetical protein